MAPKTKYKIILDLAMTVLLIVLMAYQVVGDAAHEIVGSVMFFFFMLHQLLNLGWYRALRKGRYTSYRILQTALNVLILLAMLALMVSGVMLSETVFAFLHIHGGLSIARIMHLLASYWGFILVGLHFGLHWGMFVGMLEKKTGASQRHGISLCLRGVAFAAALYGMFALFQNQIPTYLFLRTQFVFFDYSRPAAFVFTDYLAMLVTFVWLGYYGSRLFRKRKRPVHFAPAESEKTA